MLSKYSWFHNRRVRVASLILLVQAGIYYTVAAQEVLPNVQPWNDFARRIGDWTEMENLTIERDVLERLRPDDYMNRTYRHASSDVRINLFVGYFRSQRRGFLPHSPEDCLPGAGWKVESTSDISIPTPDGTVNAKRFVTTKAGSRVMVVYWYQVGRKTFTSQAKAQFYSLPQLLSHGRTDIALVRTILTVDGSSAQGTLRLVDTFAGAAYPLVVAHLT